MRQTYQQAVTLAGTVFILLLGVAGELALLREIFIHPAAPLLQDDVQATLLHYGFLVLIPFVSQLCVCVFAINRKGGLRQGARWAVVFSATGILAVVLAFRNFGHATPGFLVLGYFAQWGVVLFGVRRLWVGRKETLLT